MSGDRRRHVKWRAALCKKIGSPDYDTWIEALVKLNDTYIGSKPYNAVDLIDKAYSRRSNRTTACAVGFGLWRRIDGGTGLIPWPIAAAQVCVLWRKGGDLSRSLRIKVLEQKSTSPRTKDHTP